MKHESTGSAPQQLRRNRDFLRLASGQAVSQLGSSVAAFAVPLAALQLTDSAFAAGLTIAAGSLGHVSTSLLAGAAVDRWAARAIMILSASLRMAIWASVAFVAVVDELNVTCLVGVTYISGVCAAFYSSAEAAALKQIVPAGQLPAALSVSEGRAAAAALLGGPIGGVLLVIDQSLPFVVNAISFAFSLWTCILIRHPLGRPDRTDLSSIRGDIAAGLRYVWRRIALRVIISTATVVNVVIAAFQFCLIVILQRQGVHLGVIGLVESAVGAGLLFGAFLAPKAIRRIPIGWIAIGALWLMSLAHVGMALAVGSSLTLLLILNFVCFLLAPALNASLFSYVAATTPTAYQGRVEGIENLLSSALSPLAPLLGAALLATVSNGATLGGLVGLLAASAIALAASPSVRDLPLMGDVEGVD